MPEGISRCDEGTLEDIVEMGTTVDVSNLDVEDEVLIEEVARECETVFGAAKDVCGSTEAMEIEEAVEEYDGEYTKLKQQSRNEALKLLVQSVMAMRYEQLDDS